MNRDVKELTPAAIEFLNAKKHKFVIRGGSSDDKYPYNERLDITIGPDGVDCKWNCKFFGYDWNQKYFQQAVKKAMSDAIIASAVSSSGSAPGGGTAKVLSDLNARFGNLPDYFNKDFGELAVALTQLGQWANGGAPFAFELSREVVDFDQEVKSQNCDPRMKGQLLVNCGKLLMGALQNFTATANAKRAEFAAACPKRTVKFVLHENYRAARRRWTGVPEADLRTGALVFMCTIDSFLDSRFELIGKDLAAELESVAASASQPQEEEVKEEDDDSPKITKKECSMCKGAGTKLHSICNGRGCSKCNRGQTGERCGNCYGKGYFEYRK
jgi:hypothetical protein